MATPEDYSMESKIVSNDALIARVLKYVPVRDVIDDNQVNSPWERMCYPILRDKLRWVICSSSGKDGDQLSGLRSFCNEVRTICIVARAAGKQAALCFLAMSAFRYYESTVIRKVRQSVLVDCALVHFKSKRQKHSNFEKTRNGLTVCVIFNSVSNISTVTGIRTFHVRSSKTSRGNEVASSPRYNTPTKTKNQGIRTFHLRSSKTSRVNEMASSSRYNTPTKAKNHKRLSKLEAKFAASPPKARGLGRVSQFFRRLVNHEQANSPEVTFKNTGRGVFTFTLQPSGPLKYGPHVTSSYTDRVTGHKLQVATTVLLAKNRRRSRKLLLSLRNTLTDDTPAIVVVLQPDHAEGFAMEHIQCIFCDFPIIVLGGKASDEACCPPAAITTTPPSRGKVTVMVLRLMRVESVLKKSSTTNEKR